MKFSIAVIASLSVWTPFDVAANDPPTLTHNPFSRPSSEVTIDSRRVTDPRGNSSSTPVLRATMVSDSSRLANVEGHILQVGDEIQGYELLEIYEEFAVFARGNKTITVFVKPGLKENDE